MGGVSAVDHKTSLYAYTIAPLTFPIKFLIDIVGCFFLWPEHWYIPSQFYLVLDSIETITDIYNAISEGKIIKILEDEYVLVNYMNLFLGIKYMGDELKEMVENNL